MISVSSVCTNPLWAFVRYNYDNKPVAAGVFAPSSRKISVKGAVLFGGLLSVEVEDTPKGVYVRISCVDSRSRLQGTVLKEKIVTSVSAFNELLRSYGLGRVLSA